MTITLTFLLAAAAVALLAVLTALWRSRRPLAPTFVCRHCNRGFRRPSDAFQHVSVAHPKGKA